MVHGVDLKAGRQLELDDFDYAIDFHEIYRPMGDGRLYTRSVDEESVSAPDPQVRSAFGGSRSWLHMVMV